jgi:hypothetical protein
MIKGNLKKLSNGDWVAVSQVGKELPLRKGPIPMPLHMTYEDIFVDGKEVYYKEENGEAMIRIPRDEMKNLLFSYQMASESIFTAFGLDNVYGEIVDQTGSEWEELHGEEVRWVQKDKIYSNEVVSGPFEHENYRIYKVDNGCGEKYWQVFDQEKYKEDLVG